MPSEYLIVTQCFYPDVGGIEGFMTGLADYTHSAGHVVTVLAERIRHKSAAPVSPKPYDVMRFGGPRPWRRWRKRMHLAGIARQRGKHIRGLFLDSWKSVEALPTHLDLPVTVLAHGMEYMPDANPGKKQRISAALARCSAVIANSRYTAALVLPYLGENVDKLDVVLPPITPIGAPTPRAVEAMRGRIGGEGPVIATVTRLEPRKGIDAVIRALPDVLARHPSCRYVVAGAGEDRERLEALAAGLNVRDAVLFLGRVSDEDKAALLSIADVFGMPVRREGRSVEGFGLSYAEAGWFGVPSLAGREGGAAEAVLDGETGLVCDGLNGAEVAGSLIALLDDEALRKRMGEAAKLRVRSELIWPAVIERYLNRLKSS